MDTEKYIIIINLHEFGWMFRRAAAINVYFNIDYITTPQQWRLLGYGITTHFCVLCA